MRKALIAILILAPLLGLLGFIAKIETERRNATPWRVSIEGYDPRDMLRGHYLTFQYKWQWRGDDPSETPSCLCLNHAPGSPETPEVSICAFEDTCASRVKGESLAIGRVYIPEEHASALERKFRDGVPMAVDIHVRANGEIMIKNLVVEGVPLETHLQATGGNP